MEINLSVMPSGTRYEDTYGKYLSIFEQIAMTPADEQVTVVDPPLCWVPLLAYLGCEVSGFQFFFENDLKLSNSYIQHLGHKGFDKPERTYVEVMCGFRPELVDALWKCDAQWNTDRVITEGKREFIVTNNGSFFRPEVTAYLNTLADYTPTKRKVVLVPCAADKPYPSPLMQKVIDILPPDFYVANATGVLGIVPQDLWPIMPYYDSGIPNEWRLFNIAKAYFSYHTHDVIIAYTDFYNLSLSEAFNSAGLNFETSIEFVNPIQFYADYLPLHEDEYFDKLKATLDQYR